MVKKISLIEVYCTRPGCQDPINNISENFLSPDYLKNRTPHCNNCGMPLIFERRFLPITLIGEGGFGRTFLARDLKPNQEQYVVVKQLCPKIPPGRSHLYSSEIELIERKFQDEGNVLKRFNHKQIPQFLTFFDDLVTPDIQNLFAGAGNRQKFFYLVQEYINGQSLDRELGEHGKFSENEVVKVLLQILEILKYIHQEGAIHRDIKPSNIIHGSDGKLYLIDFGAVKQIVLTDIPVEQSCILGTRDYAPPEQFDNGEISPSLDLYSLAATCVCLLTGRNPDINSNNPGKLRHGNNWNWECYVQVNHNLAAILNRMLLPEPQDRYQSAQEVLNALPPAPTVLKPQSPPIQAESSSNPIQVSEPSTTSYIKMLRKFARKWRWVVLGLLVVLGLAIYNIFSQPCLKYSCNTKDNFSWGEQVLIKDNSSNEKKAGTLAFERGDYQAAITNFKQSLTSKRNDPEALIYLNNAYAARTDNPIRIAVSIPINDQGGIYEEMLRGVAHVQSEVNCGINNYQKELDTQSKCNPNGINGRFLQVWIANDQEDPNVAKDVAKAFGKNQDILGVIGPYSSKITSIAGKIYGKNNLVLISPASTVSRSLLGLSDYVFRTAYTDRTQAADLVSYMMDPRHPLLRRAVIVKHPEGQDIFSDSLSAEFKQELQNRQGQVVKECILDNNKHGQIADCIQSNQNTADVVLVALTRKYLEGKETVFFINNPRLKVLGGDTMYSINLREAGRSAINEKLVVAVPWNRSNDKDPFERTSEHLWGKVNWRTAMTYDATKAMVDALKKTNGNPSRENLYTALKDGFSTEGATGRVEFCPNADRKQFTGLGVLVKVEDFSPDPTKPQLDFVIKDRPERKRPCM